MKIDSKLFGSFINKISLNGEIVDGILDFQKDNIESKMKNENHTLVTGILSSKSFKSYEPIGKITILSFKKLIDFLNRFDNEVEINKDNNMLILTTKEREAELILAHPDSIVPIENIPSINPSVTFELDSKILQNSLKNSTIVGKEIDICFSGENK